MRRLEDKDSSPVRLGAVRAALEPPAADEWLEHNLRTGGLSEVVSGYGPPPLVEEDSEGHSQGNLHGDRLADLDLGLVCHRFDLLVGCRSKGGECLGPVPIEVVSQPRQRVRVQLVEPPIASGPTDHEARGAQHAQMHRHRRSADRHLASELGDREGTGSQSPHDATAERVAERIELGIDVNIH